MRKIYSALDIGSNSIKLVVGEFINNKFNILCAIKKISHGFKSNHIVDQNKLSICLNEVIKEAEEKLNFKIVNVILSIPSDYNEFILTEKSLEITNEEYIVTSEDVSKLMQISFDNNVKPNDELLSLIPVMFKVGNQETLNPVGKKAKNITLKSVLVTTDKKSVYDIVNFVTKCGLNVVDIVPNGLSDYYNFKNPELDSKNVIVVNIGSTSINISVFNKGIYINNSVLDNGGYEIDKLIALKYNLRRKEALYVKEHFAKASLKNANDLESISVIDRDDNEITISEEEITDLVNKKIIEILKLIKKSINHLTKKEISYIIITGGLSGLTDINIEINEIFGDIGKIGNINNIGARDNSYSTSLGSLKFFDNKLSIRNKEYMCISDEDLLKMCETNKTITNDSIIGKVFGYFFDN